MPSLNPVSGLTTQVVPSGNSFTASGFLGADLSGGQVAWTGTATAVVQTPFNNWTAFSGSMAQELAAESNGATAGTVTTKFTNPALSILGAPASSSGLAIWGDPSNNLSDGTAQDEISYAFSAPLPAGTTFLLWDPGVKSFGQGQPVSYGVSATLGGAKVDTSAWSFAVQNPTAHASTSNVSVSASTVSVGSYDGTFFPDTVVQITTTVPIDAITVRANTIPFDYWGLTLPQYAGFGVSDVATAVAAYLTQASYSAAAIALAASALKAAAGFGQVVTVPYVAGSFPASKAGAVNLGVVAAAAAGSSVPLPFGYGAVVAQGGNAVTLSDAGAAGAVLVGNAGPTVFNSTGAGVSLVGGQGTNRFNVAGSAAVATGDGKSTVNATGTAAVQVTTGAGGSTVVLAGGASTVQANGQDTVLGGAGAVTVNAAKGAVAIGGAGLMTFTGGSATSVVFGGKGGLTFIGGAAFEIAVGTTGPLNARAGSGGGEFFGNAGGDVLQSGTGQTIMVLSAGGKAVSTGSAGNYLVAGAGAATLDGGAATGNDVFFGGTGQDAILCGSGNDLVGTGSGTSTVKLGSGTTTVFAFGSSTITAGSGSATVVMGGTVALNIAAGAARSFALFNFVPGTDKLNLSGYNASTIGNAIANQVNGGGQTVLTLSDNTQLQLIGVARVDARVFG